MNDLLCCLCGLLIALSVYLLLSKELMRWLFGIVIFSTTINICLLLAGRVTGQYPAFVSEKMLALNEYSNPLTQAMILTAIVIAFGLVAFTLVLTRKVWIAFNTTNINLIIKDEKRQEE